MILIIWKQIINYAKQKDVDIIFITEEEKDDWWYEIAGEKIGAKLELRREFERETGKRFLMHNLSSFFFYFNEYIGKQNTEVGQISESVIKEVEITRETYGATNITDRNFDVFYKRITTEDFVEELNNALSYFYSFNGFLSAKHFIKKILASKNYDIGLSWEKANELVENDTIEMYTHHCEDGRPPLRAIRFKAKG